MFRSSSYVLAVCVVLLSSCARNVEPSQEVIQASIDWIIVVDDEKYEQAWQQTSEIFQSSVPMAQWLKIVGEVRAPLGKNIGRILRAARAKTDPAASPTGEYLLLTYDAAFEKNRDVVETHTLYQERDGSWRTAGYFIK